MKHIKLFEGFIREVFDDVKKDDPGVDIFSHNFRERVADSVKSEIGVYMYDILDEYGVDSDSEPRYLDYSMVDRPESLLKLRYRNIVVPGNRIDDFLNRYDRLYNIMTREYGLDVSCFASRKKWDFETYDIMHFKSGDYNKRYEYNFNISLKDKDEELHLKSKFL